MEMDILKYNPNTGYFIFSKGKFSFLAALNFLGNRLYNADLDEESKLLREKVQIGAQQLRDRYEQKLKSMFFIQKIFYRAIYGILVETTQQKLNQYVTYLKSSPSIAKGREWGFRGSDSEVIEQYNSAINGIKKYYPIIKSENDGVNKIDSLRKDPNNEYFNNLYYYRLISDRDQIITNRALGLVFPLLNIRTVGFMHQHIHYEAVLELLKNVPTSILKEKARLTGNYMIWDTNMQSAIRYELYLRKRQHRLRIRRELNKLPVCTADCSLPQEIWGEISTHLSFSDRSNLSCVNKDHLEIEKAQRSNEARKLGFTGTDEEVSKRYSLALEEIEILSSNIIEKKDRPEFVEKDWRPHDKIKHFNPGYFFPKDLPPEKIIQWSRQKIEEEKKLELKDRNYTNWLNFAVNRYYNFSHFKCSMKRMYNGLRALGAEVLNEQLVEIYQDANQLYASTHSNATLPLFDKILKLQNNPLLYDFIYDYCDRLDEAPIFELIEMGADVNQTDRNHIYILYHLIYRNAPIEIIQRFLRYDLTLEHKQQALDYARKLGKENIAKMIQSS